MPESSSIPPPSQPPPPAPVRTEEFGASGELRFHKMTPSQRWIRFALKTDHQLRWRRVLGEDEVVEVRSGEVADEFESEVQQLSEAQLQLALTCLGLPAPPALTKMQLIDALTDAPGRLEGMDKARLQELLVHVDLDPAGVSERDMVLYLRRVALKMSSAAERGFVIHCVEAGGRERRWVEAHQHLVNTERLKPPLDRSCHCQSLAHITGRPFDEKINWFTDRTKEIRIPWEAGHVEINVRRSHLLEDSFAQFRKLKPSEMHHIFRFQFTGEPAQDAGGVAREWFELVSTQLFNVDFGLFEYGATDNLCYKINPNSGIANELHLHYFHFAGRLLGKAMMDRNTVPPHFTMPMYKMMLGWPIVLADLVYWDQTYARSLNDILKAESETFESVFSYLDFTFGFENFGQKIVEPLMPGGAETALTMQNRGEYAALLLKHLLFTRVQPQLEHFLQGLHEVIPEAMLAAFNFRELELLICGLPDIDVNDWHSNTIYKGFYRADGDQHVVVKWFWEVVRSDLSVEERAQLLQFTTGTSRVPVQGFKALQGVDGSIKPFCVEGVRIQDTLFPRAHTCFNRIEVPNYKSKAELLHYLRIAITMERTGFGID